MRYGEQDAPSVKKPEPDNKSKTPPKKISKEIGEYIDYEETDN